MFGTPIDAAIAAHAEAEAPRESCGFVVDSGDGIEYQPAHNIAPDPLASFRIADDALLPILRAGTLRAVVHSHPHPSPPCPSLVDMRQQLAHGVPWGIVPVGAAGDAGRPFWWGAGVPALPLVGRGYRHGVADCYSIIRDWYRVARGLVLPDVPREWRWWSRADHPDLYEVCYAKNGFREITPAAAAPGDVLLMAIGGGVISHGGVLVSPGVMLHHPSGTAAYDPSRLSRRDPAVRWWPHVRRVLRYDGARA